MSTRGEETREKIRAVALALFQEKGFDGATMREIAAEAKVATGAAYYYFPSKESLVLEFYARLQNEVDEKLSAALEGHRELRERLDAALRLKFGLLRPNRRFLGALVRAGLDPENPVSPFSAETTTLRERSIGIFRRTLEGSDVKIPADLAPHLPRLLWLYYMGLILFWLFDRSEQQKRTDRLIARSLDAVATAIKLSRFRVAAPLRKAVLGLLSDLEGDPV
ncbi:MAG: TetR family transcriptional regulator [Thermoanaerobaculia bacterium]|nr:TetR family transcriptional regulator [Thermoanaerobaculia bacterium]